MGVMLGLLLALVTGGLLLWLFPVSSQISAMIEIKEEATNVMNEKKTFSPRQLEVFQETQASMITSHFVLSSALGRRDIAQLEAVRKEEPDPITWLQEDLRVAFKGENLLLSYSGEEDSEEMKKVIDAVIEAYKQEVLVAKTLSTEQMKENLSKLHKELAGELKDKIEKYESLSAELDGAESPIANTILNMLMNEVRVIQTEIIKKKQELVDYAITRAVAEQQAKSTTALEAAVTEAMANDPNIKNYDAEEYALSSQVRQLKARSKSGSSAEIKRLTMQLRQLQQEAAQYQASAEAETRKALKNAPDDTLNALTTEFILRRNNILSEIQKLEAEYEEKVGEIQQKGVRSAELSILKTEIEQLQEIENDMEYRLREWKIQDQAAAELFRVLHPAKAVNQINTVQRWALAALGGIAAFCATCYGVALIEFRRRRLNGASDVDEGLGIRVLGVLPPVASRKALAPGSMIAAQLSESIDNVRATLMHDSTTHKRQVVLVTSPATMEGTTTVASHLALSLTRAGRRTLLIDGDIREPALHKLFGMPMENGLSEVLRSEIDVADAVRPTNTEGLWLLTAGHCDMEAVQALSTDQPQPILEKLRAEFDFIIIDGAPVLGLSDTISIGQHVDGAILTVLRDHSEVRKVHEATELLKSMGIKLLGSVVNGVPLKSDRRIAPLHKNNAKQQRKLAATAAPSGSSQAAPQAAEGKATKNRVQPNEEVLDLDDFGVEDLGVTEEIDLDLDDLGIDDK
jgi:capsular exopolysaccharide synthesis family protein